MIADPISLSERIRSGDQRALARGISIVEDRREGSSELLSELYPASLSTQVVGLTGAPGAGKSTLTSRLISALRSGGNTVAVLAVDPSSPFTGGAILGDRIRMQEHASDSGVYVRSMSSRGRLGGLADTSTRVLVLLAAAGFDSVFVETVGVGQSETEIAGAADTTIVIVTPGWGDGVQAAKAGLLEIADIFCVNKADLAGADDVARDLTLMLELGGPAGWSPPIVKTSATQNTGIGDLWDAVESHRTFLGSSGAGRERLRRRVDATIRAAAASELVDQANQLVIPDGLLDQASDGRTDPWSAARELIS